MPIFRAIVLALLTLLAAPVAAQKPAQPPPTGVIKLRVLDCNGGPLSRCRVSLLRVFPNNPLGVGKVPDFADRDLVPSDFDGKVATLRGIPRGDLAVLVEAAQHAMTRSATFRIGDDDAAQEVVVKLSRGATVTGVVLGADGKPVAGALVRSGAPNAFDADSEFGKVVAKFMPRVVTEAQGTTDAQGRFRLESLGAGKYRFTVLHPDHCVGQLDADVSGEQPVEVGKMTLAQGVQVEGTVQCEGTPVAGVKVTVALPVSDENPRQPGTSWSATTDDSGRYRFDRRLPPGSYTIHAMRPQQGKNPFETLLQMRQTQRELVLDLQRDKVRQGFELQME